VKLTEFGFLNVSEYDSKKTTLIHCEFSLYMSNQHRAWKSQACGRVLSVLVQCHTVEYCFFCRTFSLYLSSKELKTSVNWYLTRGSFWWVF